MTFDCGTILILFSAGTPKTVTKREVCEFYFFEYSYHSSWRLLFLLLVLLEYCAIIESVRITNGYGSVCEKEARETRNNAMICALVMRNEVLCAVLCV